MANSISLEVGDSFEVYDSKGRHLHFIIAEASSNEHDLIILVYLSSSTTRYKDKTTIIKKGEHPYITKTDEDSWVRYQNTIICSRDDIRNLITTHYGKISEDLLHRIQKDLINSPKVSREIKRKFHSWKMDKLFNSIK